MKLLLTSALLALCPLLASATAITSGTIAIGSVFGTFNFSGADFSLSGGMCLDNWGPARCSPCSTAEVTAIQTGTDFASGSATVGGTSFPGLGWGSDDPNANQPTNTHFEISGPPINLSEGTGTYQGPFSFIGSLCGNPPGDRVAARTSCAISLPNLTGSGIVYLNTFTLEGHSGTSDVQSAVYVFTPEPRTWILAVTGIVAVLGWRRKTS
jgi:hypothetical protein